LVIVVVPNAGYLQKNPNTSSCLEGPWQQRNAPKDVAGYVEKGVPIPLS